MSDELTASHVYVEVVMDLQAQLAQLRLELAAAQAETRKQCAAIAWASLAYFGDKPGNAEWIASWILEDDPRTQDVRQRQVRDGLAWHAAALRAARPGAADETESDDPHTPQGATGDTE